MNARHPRMTELALDTSSAAQLVAAPAPSIRHAIATLLQARRTRCHRLSRRPSLSLITEPACLPFGCYPRRLCAACGGLGQIGAVVFCCQHGCGPIGACGARLWVNADLIAPSHPCGLLCGYGTDIF